MRKIRIAQIGIGHDHAAEIFKRLKGRPEEIEVVGYALPEGEDEIYAARLSVFSGYRMMSVEEILADGSIDAVAVETDECRLTKYALLAANAGKHVHMDKPGGMSVADFEALVEAVKARGLTLNLGYMYRYNPLLMRVFREISEGLIGDVVTVEAEMNGAYPDPSRTTWLTRFGRGGMMFFLGCHMVDLVVRLLGEPQRITTHGFASGSSGSDAVDCGMAVFEYPRARATVRSSSIEWGGFRRRHLVIAGTKGTIDVRPLEFNLADGVATEATYYIGTKWGRDGVTVRSDAFDRYDDMITAFLASVRGEHTNPYTPDFELMLYKIFMKACDMY